MLLPVVRVFIFFWLRSTALTRAVGAAGKNKHIQAETFQTDRELRLPRETCDVELGHFTFFCLL